MALMDQTQANKALEMNLIRQDQYDAMFPKTTVEPPVDEPAVPMQQYPAPAGPYVAPDFMPNPNQDSSILSRMGEAMGMNPTATIADLNPFPGPNPSPERIASATRQQEALLAPQERGPVPLMNDQYPPPLAADVEAKRRQDEINNAINNYPGSKAYGMMEKGIKSQGEATRQFSREQALEYQNMMDQMDAYNKDDSIRKTAEDKRIEDGRMELEKMQSDIASTKITPKDMFADKSTGEKILGYTALILGGFGGDGGNAAVDVLDKAIDRDIEAQKANYNVKKQGFEQKQSIYGQMMDKFKSDGAARAASKIDLYKKAEMKLAQLGARYTDAETEGKVQEQLGKLRLLQDQAQSQFLNSLMNDDPYKNMDKDQRDRLVPGYGLAANPDLAKQAVAATTMADNTISNINTILEKAKKAGRFDTGANSEISGLVQLLRSESREAVLGPGTVQAAERELLEDLIKDPGAFFTNRDKAQRALAVIRDAAARTRDNKLKSFSVRPMQSRYRSLEYQK